MVSRLSGKWGYSISPSSISALIALEKVPHSCFVRTRVLCGKMQTEQKSGKLFYYCTPDSMADDVSAPVPRPLVLSSSFIKRSFISSAPVTISLYISLFFSFLFLYFRYFGLCGWLQIFSFSCLPLHLGYKLNYLFCYLPLNRTCFPLPRDSRLPSYLPSFSQSASSALR